MTDKHTFTYENEVYEVVSFSEIAVVDAIHLGYISFRKITPPAVKCKFKVGEYWKTDYNDIFYIVEIIPTGDSFDIKYVMASLKSRGQYSQLPLTKCNEYFTEKLDIKVGEVWESADQCKWLIESITTDEDYPIAAISTRGSLNGFSFNPCKLIRKSDDQSLDDFMVIPNPNYKGD